MTLLSPFALLQCQDSGNVSDHIVGGTVVAADDPDQQLVVMLKMRKGEKESVCTGTLIGERVILTAAHCVENVHVENIHPFFVTGAGCPVNQVRPTRGEVIRKLVHRGFDGTPQSLSDLALLYLADSAPTEQRRLPIAKTERPTQDQVMLIGFGITRETARDSQVLRRISKSWQQDLQPRGRALVIDQTKGSGGFCRGDSGAPVIGESWGEPQVWAVNSANVGITPDTECQTMSLAMDTRVFADWIQRNQHRLETSSKLSRFFSSDSQRVD